MNKKKLIIILLLLSFIVLVVLWMVKWFKKIWHSELTQLVDRYREIQDEYTYHESKISELHIEAEEIREIALDKYGVTFTEAWQVPMW